MKVKMSLKDRAALIQLIPQTGSIDEVKKYGGWIDSLNRTEAEKEQEKGINELKSKEDKSKAINEFYHLESDFEVDNDLLAYVKEKLTSMNEAKVFNVSDDIEFYEKILNLEISE